MKDSIENIKEKLDKLEKLFKNLEKENQELQKIVEGQKSLILTMRDVLRFCARNDAGTFYQQESARAMLKDNTHLVWDRFNNDGTYTEKWRNWLRTFEDGEEAVKKLDEYEKELLSL